MRGLWVVEYIGAKVNLTMKQRNAKQNNENKGTKYCKTKVPIMFSTLNEGVKGALPWKPVSQQIEKILTVQNIGMSDGREQFIVC